MTPKGLNDNAKRLKGTITSVRGLLGKASSGAGSAVGIAGAATAGPFDELAEAIVASPADELAEGYAGPAEGWLNLVKGEIYPSEKAPSLQDVIARGEYQSDPGTVVWPHEGNQPARIV